MKTTLFLLGVLLTAGSCITSCSDDAKEQNFDSKIAILQQKYPQAMNICWNKSKDQHYDIATFTLPKGSRAAAAKVDTVDVWFGQNDQIRLVEQEISLQDLPQAVLEKFNKTRDFIYNELYSNSLFWELDDVYRLERDQIISYKFEMEDLKTEREIDLYFDAQGILLKEIEDLDEEDEEETPLEIPENIKSWIAKNYAKAEILDYDMEQEDGTREHELDLRDGGMILEVVLLEDKAGNLTADVSYLYASISALPKDIAAKVTEVLAAQSPTVVSISDLDTIVMSKSQNAEIYIIEFDKGDDEYTLTITKKTTDDTITAGQIEAED